MLKRIEVSVIQTEEGVTWNVQVSERPQPGKIDYVAWEGGHTEEQTLAEVWAAVNERIEDLNIE